MLARDKFLGIGRCQLRSVYTPTVLNPSPLISPNPPSQSQPQSQNPSWLVARPITVSACPQDSCFRGCYRISQCICTHPDQILSVTCVTHLILSSFDSSATTSERGRLNTLARKNERGMLRIFPRQVLRRRPLVAPKVAGLSLLLSAGWALQRLCDKCSSTVAQGADWVGQAREEPADTVAAGEIYIWDDRRILPPAIGVPRTETRQSASTTVRTCAASVYVLGCRPSRFPWSAEGLRYRRMTWR